MDAGRSISSPIEASNVRQRPSGDIRRPSRRQPSLATHVVIALVGLLLAFLLAPRFPLSVREFFNKTQHWRASSPSIALRNPLVFEESDTCPTSEQHLEFKGTFNTRPERSMALADRAKRVAAEFDFEKDAVNKAVKEFIREMGMRRGMCQPFGTLTARR